MIMMYPPSFCRLLIEVEEYQLPPRRRVEEGDCVGGRVMAEVSVAGGATGMVAVPPVVGTIRATISMKAILRSRQRSIPLKVKKTTQPRPPRPKAPRKPKERQEPGPRPKRSQAAIDAAAQKTRAQRAERVAAILPLVAEARAQGAVLLRDICLYLDSIGHKPQRGERWSVPTLSTILPGEDERRVRDERIERLIEQARAEGASSQSLIAIWLNERGHRTARDKAWTRANVMGFLLSRNAARDK